MHFHFKLGGFDCFVLSDGGRQGAIENEIVDVSSQELTQAMEELGYDTTVQVSYNVLFIDTGTEKVLFDTGTGQGPLLDSLAEVGFKPQDISVVVLTHGDGDHIGGVATPEGKPAFPNARYVFWDDAWDQWTEPKSRAALVYQFLPLFRRLGRSEEELEKMGERRAEFGASILPSLKDQFSLVELGEQFLPGFSLFDAKGHRSDHVGVAITSGDQTLLHVADAIRHPVQVAHPDWNGSLDSFAQEAAETRKAIVQRAKEENALLFATHMAFPGVGTVQKDGDSQRFVPLPQDGDKNGDGETAA